AWRGEYSGGLLVEQRLSPPSGLLFEDELRAFGSAKDLDAAASFAGAPARELDHAIDLRVGVGRLMVKQRHASRSRLNGDIGDVRGAAVTPAAVVVILLGRVLRIHDEQVDAAQELDQASIAAVHVTA